MAEEIFDVVNDRDEVIGRASRSEVHARGLLHRAAHVLVFNARGQAFLQKRSMLKDRQPGVWDSSASGHLSSGESCDVCAVREVREELGVSRDGSGVRVRLSRAPRRAVHAASGGNRARRVVRARRNHALAGGTATRFRQCTQINLEDVESPNRLIACSASGSTGQRLNVSTQSGGGRALNEAEQIALGVGQERHTTTASRWLLGFGEFPAALLQLNLRRFEAPGQNTRCAAHALRKLAKAPAPAKVSTA